jgi:hypothetical protein
VIDLLVWKNGNQTVTVIHVHNEIKKMRTNCRNDHGIEGVNDRVVISFDMMVTGQEAKCTLDVLSFAKVSKPEERGDSDRSFIEHHNVVVSIMVDSMVINHSLNFMMLQSVVSREMKRNVSGIIGNIVTTSIGKDTITTNITPVGCECYRELQVDENSLKENIDIVGVCDDVYVRYCCNEDD